MKTNNQNIILIALLCLASQSVFCQGFLNLDFEDATITPTPVGGSTYPADPTLAFPAWTIGGSGTVVMYNDLSLGSPAVSLMGPDFPNLINYTPLQGSYSALLYYDNRSIFAPPTISQTGLVPAGAQSINFLVGNGESDAAVTLNGENIPLVSISGGRLAGNISAFAGSVAQLTFSTANDGLEFNEVYFDDIQFSSTAVPEPSEFALGALGALLLGFRRWQKSS